MQRKYQSDSKQQGEQNAAHTLKWWHVDHFDQCCSVEWPGLYADWKSMKFRVDMIWGRSLGRLLRFVTVLKFDMFDLSSRESLQGNWGMSPVCCYWLVWLHVTAGAPGNQRHSILLCPNSAEMQFTFSCSLSHGYSWILLLIWTTESLVDRRMYCQRLVVHLLSAVGRKTNQRRRVTVPARCVVCVKSSVLRSVLNVNESCRCFVQQR